MTQNHKRLPISCFIITQDETDRITPTIESVIDWVDEVIIIDSGSTDGTQDMCRALGAQVMHNDWVGYGQQKRFGEDQCKHNWVLNLDADEVLLPELIAEIKSFFEDGFPKHSFLRMRLLTVYPFHSKPRLWADYHNYIRVYDKTKGRFALSATEDLVDNKGLPVIQLKQPALHFSNRSLSHLIVKTDSYWNLQIKTKKPKSTLVLKLRLFTEFPIMFFKYYILRCHFTGGFYGFSTAMVHAFSRFSRIAKMLEHSIAQRKNKE